MATVQGVVGKLDHPRPHTRVASAALRQPLPGKCTVHHHYISTINPPKQEKAFTPHGGLNLGKIARVISVMLPHVGLLFVQRDSPLPNQQGVILVP